MGGLFDDSLDDDDYVDEYDDEELEDSDDELGVDYHEVRIPQESISRSPESEYLHPELTPPGGGDSDKPYSSIAQAAIAQSVKKAVHKKKLRKTKKLISKLQMLHKKKHLKVKPGYSKKKHLIASAHPRKKIRVKKLPDKLKHKHGIKHVVLRHKSGKRTVFV